MELLRTDYHTNEEATGKLPGVLIRFYQQNYPELYAPRAQEIEHAARAVLAIYNRYVYPDPKVTWAPIRTMWAIRIFQDVSAVMTARTPVRTGRRLLKTAAPVTNHWQWGRPRRRS